jgi:hypothetical protein
MPQSSYEGADVVMMVTKLRHSKVKRRVCLLSHTILIASLCCSWCCHGLASPRPTRPLFVDQVKQWLTDQGVAHHEAAESTSTTIRQHAMAAATTWLLEIPVVDQNNTTTLLLNLLPTPSSLGECLPPRCAMALTNIISSDYNNDNKLPQMKKKYSKIIHLHQDVWLAKTDIVQCRLLAQVGHGRPSLTSSSSLSSIRRIFARKTTSRRIPAGVAADFLQNHHLWGATKAKHSYGLFLVNNTRSNSHNNKDKDNNEDDDDDEQLVAVATFSSRRNVVRLGRLFRSHELLRFCTQRNMTVVGGISKLLKCFIRDQRPDDIVTVVDRDWGHGSGWHGDRSGVGFATVATMDPIVMAVNPDEPGIRRHLVGAGIRRDKNNPDQRGQRVGLPLSICDELDQVGITADQSRAILAKHNYFLVYDAGVERLFKIVNDTLSTHAATSLDYWNGSEPKYAESYYSNNAGIGALLQEAASVVIDQEGRPVKSFQAGYDIGGDGYLASWRRSASSSGSTTVAPATKLVFSAPSSLDVLATVEVRERSDGWRTLGIVGGVTKSIYHAVYKVDPHTGHIEPRAVVADYIKIMTESFLAVMKQQGKILQKAAPLRMLHLGLGAGTLMRLLSRELLPAGCNHVGVELDSGVVAATEGCLPGSTVIYNGNALTVLRDQKYVEIDAFDGIFVDIFDEKNLLPPSFYSTEYLGHLRDDMLKSSGLVLFNLHSGGKERQRVIDDARATFAQVFSRVRLIQARDCQPNGGNGNLVLIGSMADLFALDEEVIKKRGKLHSNFS